MYSKCRYMYIGWGYFPVLAYGSHLRLLWWWRVFQSPENYWTKYRVDSLLMIPVHITWLSPAKRRDIVLNLSVCPSVRPSVRPSRSFWFCALIDSETTQPTTMKPIPYERWGSGLCHKGGPFFPAPRNFGVIGLWKRPKITYSNFWSFITLRVFDPQLQYLYHVKAQRP